MKRFLLTTILDVGVFSIAASPLEAQAPRDVAKQRSVLNYYFLLPGIGTSGTYATIFCRCSRTPRRASKSRFFVTKAQI